MQQIKSKGQVEECSFHHFIIGVVHKDFKKNVGKISTIGFSPLFDAYVAWKKFQNNGENVM